MPFTIGGEWLPTPQQQPKQPVKVFLEKRKGTIVTIIKNLDASPQEIEQLASEIKKNLGCGGAVKEGRIELQGDKVESVQKWLPQRKKK